MEGAGDEYPETAFYMAGTLDEAFEEGRRLATEATKKWDKLHILAYVRII